MLSALASWVVMHVDKKSKHSDVDFDIYVNQLPENEYDRYTLRYLDDKLVSLKYAPA